jgi:hypothetical protein
MILILRGHIRNSFDNNNLYQLVHEILKNNNDLSIYIHTWNIIQSKLSWRRLETIDKPVTENCIQTYFKDLSPLIKHIIIDDDTNIELHGKLDGRVSNSRAPLLGWKRYWYGKNKIISYIQDCLPEKKNDMIINCRFDVLSNLFPFPIDNIVNLIENNKNKTFHKNVFIYDIENLKYNQYLGIDNIYIGNIETQSKLISHFHKNLDDILKKHSTPHQEHIVFNVNNELFLTVEN